MMIDAYTVDAINEELAEARRKFPEWPVDKIHAAGIVVEEAGELMKAALQGVYEHGDKRAMEEEALHTAAMAIRFLQNL